MGLVQLAEAWDEAEVPVAPDLQQSAHVVQGALHVVADAADGAGRGEGDGKDGLQPGDGVVALLTSHLKAEKPTSFFNWPSETQLQQYKHLFTVVPVLLDPGQSAPKLGEVGDRESTRRGPTSEAVRKLMYESAP